MKKTITVLFCALALSSVACGKGEEGGGEEDGKAETSKKEGLSVGDSVVAKYAGTSFYEGTVEELGDKIKVKWKDGTKPREVAKKYVFAVPKKAHDVSEGDFVFAKWSKSGSKWWGAKVLSTGSKVKVRYVSDATEGSVSKTEVVPAPSDMVGDLKEALQNAAIVSEAQEAGSPTKPSGWSPKAGDEVVAIWAASTWYQGTVSSVSGGKPTVKWKDGSKPSAVDPAKVVPVPSSSSPKASEGDYVLVKPKSTNTGFATWRYGKVEGASGDAIDVKVQDGSSRSLEPGQYILID